MQRVVQTQRTATLRHLHDLTRLKRESLGRSEGADEGRGRGDAAARLGGLAEPRGAGDTGLAWLLVLENLVFAAEAEVRWLDHVETMLARRPAPSGIRRTHDGDAPTRHPPAVVSTSPRGDHS